MKYTIAALLCLFSYISSQAQIKVTPADNAKAQTVEVGYYTTTTILFPATIIDEDHGYKDIITEKQNGITNALKIKAFRKNFQPTNLTVYTADGKLYSFQVTYSDYPFRTVVNIPAASFDSQIALAAPVSHTTSEKLNESQLQEALQRVKTDPPFFRDTERKNKMKLRLEGIYMKNELLFLKFKISNKANLPYAIDFVRLYVQDVQNIKRKSIQQREVIPVYQDNTITIAGKSNYTYVIAIPRITLAKDNQFMVEIFERAGGRNISLDIKQKYLLEARKL